MKKYILKPINRFLKKYINGAKGAVSLLLVITMSPLSSLALMLEESARYQSAVELMQEIIDSSSFSTLADYDSYLDERFGLMAVSQETEIATSVSNYLDKNTDMLGKSVSINSENATGAFPLSNIDVLKQQLLEYSEISVATEIMADGIDLDELLKKLTKAIKLEDFAYEMDALNSCAEVAQELQKLVEAITKAINQYGVYKPALDDYISSYSNFEVKILDLVSALKDAEEKAAKKAAKEAEKAAKKAAKEAEKVAKSGEKKEEVEEVEEEIEEEEIDNRAVENALNAAKSARDNYKTKASSLVTELDALKGYIDTIFSALNKLPEKLNTFDQKVEKTLSEAKTMDSTYEWLLIVINQATTSIKMVVGDNYKDEVNIELNLLRKQITKLSEFGDGTVDSGWNASRVGNEYGLVNVSTIKSEFKEEMKKLIDVLNGQTTIEDAAKTKMSDLLDITGELLGIKGVYDSSLDATVSEACLYTNTNMALSSTLSMHSLSDLLDAARAFSNGASSGNIIETLIGMVELIKAIIEFFAAVITWVVETLYHLVDFIANFKEMYNSLLLYGYGVYNCPNRTTYQSKKTITGYSYSKVFDMAGGLYFNSLTGTLNDLSSFANQEGTDKMFIGAETEYLIIGSTSERVNQSCTFFDLYLFRLILDIEPIRGNKEVQRMAGAVPLAPPGPYYWVIMVAVMLAEPMIDTIVLVNSDKTYQYLFKKTIYITPTGFPILIKDFVDATDVSENLKKKLELVVGDGKEVEKKDGLFKSTYSEHLLLLLILSVSQTTYLQRMQNLIQMEAAKKYEADYIFDLDKAYTYIYSEVDYTLNPMFKMDSLLNNGLFKANSKQYVGY